MKYSLKAEVAKTPDSSVGHDDDQHETILFGEDLSALKDVSELPDGQPGASTEDFHANISPTAAVCSECEEDEVRRVPYVSRVIDADGNARISIYFTELEKKRWLGQIIGLMDSASEKDTVTITIAPNYSGNCDTYSYRSMLSAVERCKAPVITRAGILTTIGDVALWLAGDEPKWSTHMTAIFMRQPLAGYGGDIADLERKSRDAISSFREYSSYLVARGLFSQTEMNSMYETRGMLSLFGSELEARMAKLKQVESV